MTDFTLPSFLASLAARTPTPGGGAAAAVAGAIGAALGAMAANYTTGKKWRDRESDAKTLADLLNQASVDLLADAKADADAYAALASLPKDAGQAERQTAQQASLSVPLRILERCADLTGRLAGFRPRCNPHLIADLDAAMHLLSGAGRAAACMVHVNEPTKEQTDRVRKVLLSLMASAGG